MPGCSWTETDGIVLGIPTDGDGEPEEEATKDSPLPSDDDTTAPAASNSAGDSPTRKMGATQHSSKHSEL